MHSSTETKSTKTFSRQLGSSAAVLIVALAGFALTSTVFAAESQQAEYIQLAALESGSNSSEMDDNNMVDATMDDESEIGSIASAEDTKLGAFSMEDGAMLGVYGDGEYSDD